MAKPLPPVTLDPSACLTTGQRLGYILAEKNMTGQQLADLLNLTPKTVSAIRRGHTGVSWKIAHRIFLLLGYRAQWLRDGLGAPTEAVEAARLYAPDTVNRWLAEAVALGTPTRTELLARVLLEQHAPPDAAPASAPLVQVVTAQLDTLARLLLLPR